jgi:hemoglobin-like flavoprotein
MTSLSTVLKESWGLVEDRQDRVAQYFYARLFLSDPQLRDLFPVQMDVQRGRLLGAIVSAVQNFDSGTPCTSRPGTTSTTISPRR